MVSALDSGVEPWLVDSVVFLGQGFFTLTKPLFAQVYKIDTDEFTVESRPAMD